MIILITLWLMVSFQVKIIRFENKNVHMFLFEELIFILRYMTSHYFFIIMRNLIFSLFIELFS